jgi:hypothetical protein
MGEGEGGVKIKTKHDLGSEIFICEADKQTMNIVRAKVSTIIINEEGIFYRCFHIAPSGDVLRHSYEVPEVITYGNIRGVCAALIDFYKKDVVRSVER